MFSKMFDLFIVFLELGFLSFGGGYAMLSMLLSSTAHFGITPSLFADLNALDMIVPGPIAINSATYVGYLYYGVLGATAATIGVSLPSFILVSIITRFFDRFRNNTWLKDILSGIKPAAVGLIAAAALTIALDVLIFEGKDISQIIQDPFRTVSFISVAIFVLTATLTIRYKVNPIMLTILAGVVGAFLLA